jgi:hypothetical protein
VSRDVVGALAGTAESAVAREGAVSAMPANNNEVSEGREGGEIFFAQPRSRRGCVTGAKDPSLPSPTSPTSLLFGSDLIGSSEAKASACALRAARGS